MNIAGTGPDDDRDHIEELKMLPIDGNRAVRCDRSGHDSGVSGSLVVRSTTPADRPSVLEVVRTAFSDDTRTGDEEVDIVVNTWSLGNTVRPIDLVAVDGYTIAGHVLGARGTVGDDEVIGVAPLAVAPSHQGRGVGTMLMHGFLERADEANWPLAVLLGSPAYYCRFGFEPASRFGITYAPVGAGNPHFQARRLRAFTNSSPGTFSYCWEQTSPSAEALHLPQNAGSERRLTATSR